MARMAGRAPRSDDMLRAAIALSLGGFDKQIEVDVRAVAWGRLGDRFAFRPFDHTDSGVRFGRREIDAEGDH